MGNISVWEIVLLLLVVLLVFGPKKLPEIGRSLGRGAREFKDSISGLTTHTEEPVPETRVAATDTSGASPSPAPERAALAPLPATSEQPAPSETPQSERQSGA